MGGDFKDENFENIEVSIRDFARAILKNTTEKQISFVVHPRFFSDCKNTQEKNNKIRSLVHLMKKKRVNVYFYVNKNHLNDIESDLQKNIFYFNGDFNALLYAIEFKNTSRKKVFATLDQCNISSDNVNNKIINIFLKENPHHAIIAQDAIKSQLSVSDLIAGDL
jgi:hypothetical protein